MNEEEIKIKYIIPWLHEIGIGDDQIVLEQSFSIIIGHKEIHVGSDNCTKSSIARARLDILVRRDNINLFIVEAKAEDVVLTDDDRDQAISYARLVHPIAPYAVVTNGTDYRLYDCLSKSEIKASDIKVRGFEISFPAETIEETQEMFLRASKENLLSFCREQVSRELKILKGGAFDLNKKYIPELHVSRAEVSSAVKDLYSCDTPGLVFTANSGQGKTCSLCNVAEELLMMGRPTLFFNGSYIERDIFHAIANEFSWTYGGTNTEVAVIRKLVQISKDSFFTVIVDAIDEWSYESRVLHLNNLFSAIEGKKFKVILSCKSSFLNYFMMIRGVAGHMQRLTKIVEIKPFSDREFFKVVEKYRSFYDFHGAFEDRVLAEAKLNAFLLRVLFDVARNSDVKSLTFDSVDFFDIYYNQCLEKTENSEVADVTLRKIAGQLYLENSDFLEEDSIRTSLGLKVTDVIMADLFHYGLLVRIEKEGGVFIGFYFQQLRDYIIAFKSCNFYIKSIGDFEKEIQKVVFPSMCGDVITSYYRLASLEHKKVLDGDFRNNARAYLDLYVSVIESDFPELRTRFDPGIIGEIGFIGQIMSDFSELGLCGFREISAGDEKVYFFPSVNIMDNSNVGYINGARRLSFSSSSRGFGKDLNVVQGVVCDQIIKQLREFIKVGWLNESKCLDLAVEAILKTVSYNRRVFKSSLFSSLSCIDFPLIFDKINKDLLREKLCRYYRDKFSQEKRARGEIEELWDGNYLIYSDNFTQGELKEIDVLVNQGLEANTMPYTTTVYTDLAEIESVMLPHIETLRQVSEVIVKQNFQNEAYVRDKCCYGSLPSLLSSLDLLKSYLIDFYGAFLDNYAALVEINFPTLKQYFSLYAVLPVQILIRVEFLGSCLYGAETVLHIYICRGEGLDSTVLFFDGNDELVVSGSVIYYQGREFKFVFCESFSLKSIFYTMSSSQSKINNMTLHRLIYRRINKEFTRVEQVLKEKYGLVAS